MGLAWVKSINKILLGCVRKLGQPKNVQILNIMRLGLGLWWFEACAAFVMMGTDAPNVNILICWYQSLLISIKHWFKLEYISIGHIWDTSSHSPDLSILSLVLSQTNWSTFLHFPFSEKWPQLIKSNNKLPINLQKQD